MKRGESYFEMIAVCPMCRSKTKVEGQSDLWQIKCSYCRREFTFTKVEAKRNLKRWKMVIS